MKFLIRNFFFVLFLIFISISGCDRASCETVICGINQNCVRGACFCWDGYEGSTCQDFAAQKYVGSYLISANCPVSPYTGPNTTFISWDQSLANRITISNFIGQGTIDAFIFTDPNNQGNIIEINQSIGGFSVVGQGNYYDNPFTGNIILEIQYNIGSIYNECQLTFFRQ